VLRIMALNFMFILLSFFAKTKNNRAPKLYKHLTFMLIESYSELEFRDEILKGFTWLYRKSTKIPISILLEPYFRLTLVNLDKENHWTSMGKLQPNSVAQPGTDQFYIFNASDFDFLFSICTQLHLTPSLACQILDIAAETALKHLIFIRSALKLSLTVLARFETDKKIVSRCIGIV
jgi:hypothetical protein